MLQDTQHKDKIGSHDKEDTPATQDSAFLDLAPPEHSMPEEDNDSSCKYCEEIDACHPLGELLEEFRQLKVQFASLKSTTPPIYTHSRT